MTAEEAMHFRGMLDTFCISDTLLEGAIPSLKTYILDKNLWKAISKGKTIKFLKI